MPLGGIMVCRVEDSELYKNVFEIDGPLIEKIIVTCKTSTEADKWVCVDIFVLKLNRKLYL